jgi:hypothetical protein
LFLRLNYITTKRHKKDGLRDGGSGYYDAGGTDDGDCGDIGGGDY